MLTDGSIVGEDEDYPARVGEHRIVRWTPAAGVSVVAGTGKQGFGGDGGPAAEALLNLEPGPRTMDASPPMQFAAGRDRSPAAQRERRGTSMNPPAA
jgi:hypothetical protein